MCAQPPCGGPGPGPGPAGGSCPPQSMDPGADACSLLAAYCASRPSSDWLMYASVANGQGTYQCGTCPAPAAVTPSTAGTNEVLAAASLATKFKVAFVGVFVVAVAALFLAPRCMAYKAPSSPKPTFPRTLWQLADLATGYTDDSLQPRTSLKHYAADKHPLAGLLFGDRNVLTLSMRRRIITYNLMASLAMNIVFAAAKLVGSETSSCDVDSPSPDNSSVTTSSSSNSMGLLTAKLQLTFVQSVVVMACMFPMGMAADRVAPACQTARGLGRWVLEIVAVLLLLSAAGLELAMKVKGTTVAIKILLYALLGVLSTLESWVTGSVVVVVRWALGAYLYHRWDGVADGQALLTAHHAAGKSSGTSFQWADGAVGGKHGAALTQPLAPTHDYNTAGQWQGVALTQPLAPTHDYNPPRYF